MSTIDNGTTMMTTKTENLVFHFVEFAKENNFSLYFDTEN